MVMYRHFVYVVDTKYCHQPSQRLFALDSDILIGEGTVLDQFLANLEKFGFLKVSGTDRDFKLEIRRVQIHQFRGHEIELHPLLRNIPQALEQVGPGEVLVEAWTSHAWEYYNPCLLAVPKGSHFLHYNRMGDPNVVCDRNLNFWVAFNDSSRGHTHRLPEGSKWWKNDSSEWVARAELVYGDG